MTVSATLKIVLLAGLVGVADPEALLGSFGTQSVRKSSPLRKLE